MNNPLKAVLIGAVVASLASVSAFAQAERKPDPNARPRAALKTEAAKTGVPEIAAVAPNARMAALIRRDLIVQRNKNVANVRRIDVGVYCVQPTAGFGINPGNSIVVLTPEYFYSLYNEVTVQWASTSSGCASNEFGVYTFADVNLDGIYSFSNAVSFSIIVP